MQAPVRFAIADDHPGVVAAVRHLVCRVEGFEVVGEATSADGLLALLGRVHCDVVITDYAMPAAATATASSCSNSCCGAIPGCASWC